MRTAIFLPLFAPLVALGCGSDVRDDVPRTQAGAAGGSSTSSSATSSQTGGQGPTGGGPAGGEGPSGGAPTGGAGGTPATTPAGGTGGTGGIAPTCAADEKLCGSTCAVLDDPATGCAAEGCAPCALDHATASCSMGACSVAACEVGFEDCDHDPSNGCEASFTSVTDCGACGALCSYPNAVASCATGTCLFVGCKGGFGDCDNDESNGCETNTDTHPENCGACGNICSCNDCTAGACVGVCCSPGLGDCDNDESNGCETDLATLANCGGCGQPCAMPHAGESCPGGVCTLGSCDPGWANCDGDPANGCESDLDTLSNCGSCGVMCSLPNATVSCENGACSFIACDDDFGDCDDDPTNGCEVNLSSHPANCGACGTSCSCNQCVGGACIGLCCSPGLGNCDGNELNGCETDLTAPANCGACGQSCALQHAAESCPAGACTLDACDGGWGDCDGNPSTGCETTLNTLSNCAACGSICDLANAAETCTSGTCTLISCAAGFLDCDGDAPNGCETDIASTANCGSCGKVCDFANATETCSGGVCTFVACEAGFFDCDGNTSNGCEIDLATTADCGSCGTVCDFANATETCSAGVCTFVACEGAFSDCDGNTSNGCETSLATVQNCGGCGVQCLPGQMCTAGICAAPASCTGGGSGAGAWNCGPMGNTDCCDNNLIPGGSFSRSYDGVSSGYTDPQYVATVSSFRLDTYEVTVGRFRKFVNAGQGTLANPPPTGAGAHPQIPGSGWQSAWKTYLPSDTITLTTSLKCANPYATWNDDPQGGNLYPINCLTWYEAFAFCAWDGGRLPTEAEWNYAASGGDEQRVYPWSNPPSSTVIDDSYAVFGCNQFGSGCSGLWEIASPGGRSPKGDGRWGNADLAGNLAEVTLDSAVTPYGINPCTNCAELAFNSERIVRGGTFYSWPNGILASVRGTVSHLQRTHESGVRCARSP